MTVRQAAILAYDVLLAIGAAAFIALAIWLSLDASIRCGAHC